MVEQQRSFAFSEDGLHALQTGEITLRGQFTWSSNYTFLVEMKSPQAHEPVLAVYKPIQGERPLWDFPADSLAHREVAAYLVSQALGWNLVPPTFFRSEAPFGAGSVQLFFDHEPEHLYFNFTAEERARLRPTVIFDLLVNNADRKGGHILVDHDGCVWLIDHGICFHAQEKIRTVIWDFAGQRVPQNLRSSLQTLGQALDDDSELVSELRLHLNEAEIFALKQRALRLSRAARFPKPPPNYRAYPFPPV